MSEVNVKSPQHTPGEWKWWTSCSWRRLRSDQGHGKTLDVLMPAVMRDGHPDIIVSDGDMALIEAAPHLLALAKAYEAWEADLILNNSWSGKDGLPTLTADQYNRMLELQSMRNAAIAKAEAR